MDQAYAATDHRTENSFTVAPPHTWDGIGQALRAAYRDHHVPPREFSNILHRLGDVD